MTAVKSLPVHYHSASYVLFPVGSLSPSWLFWKSNTASVGARWGICSLANYGVAYEETQSNRVSDFCDFACSLFPEGILFDFYCTDNEDQTADAKADLSLLFVAYVFLILRFIFKNKQKWCQRQKTGADYFHYVPHHGGGGMGGGMGGGRGGHIVFSADPVGVGVGVSIGVGVGVASCLHSISLMNGWILAKLTKIYHWVGLNAE